MSDTIMKMRGGCQGKKKPLKIRKLVLQRICKGNVEMSLFCHER
jgi:hypothetical protein